MNNQHPITPPPELVDQWWDEVKQNAKYDEPIGPLVTTQAARWGADQELEACCEWLALETPEPYINALRAARRPKPPSLKEQALKELRQLPIDPELGVCASALDTIRRALEALPE